jgi:hypothetical protein
MTTNWRTVMSRIDALMLDQQTLDSEQEARLRRARRTALVLGIIAAGFFVFSIVQMMWLQHGGARH